MTDKPELTREQVEAIANEIFRSIPADMRSLLCPSVETLRDLALRALSGGVAEGYVLVPVEPTMEMLVTAAHCLDGINLKQVARRSGERTASKESIRVYKATQRWKAMLAAAPANPEGE